MCDTTFFISKGDKIFVSLVSNFGIQQNAWKVLYGAFAVVSKNKQKILDLTNQDNWLPKNAKFRESINAEFRNFLTHFYKHKNIHEIRNFFNLLPKTKEKFIVLEWLTKSMPFMLDKGVVIKFDKEREASLSDYSIRNFC